MEGGYGASAELQYIFTATDSVTDTVARIDGATQGLVGTTEAVTDKTTRQNVAFMTQTMAVMAAYGGMRRLTSSMHELGLISDAGAAAMGKLNAAVGLVVGTFQLLKGAIQIINMLREAEIGLSIVETFRAVLTKGPAAVALVGAALGVTAGVAGYLIGSASAGGGGTTVNQEVNFGGSMSPTEKRAVARDTIEIMGG